MPNKDTLVSMLSSAEAQAVPQAAPAPPGPPTGLTATPAGDGQVSLSWAAPGSDGGAPVSGYRVYQGTSPGKETAAHLARTTATSAAVSGLTNGTTYYFVVTAANTAGEGPRSAEAQAPSAPPGGPPTGLTILLAAVTLAAAGIALVVRHRRLRSRPPPALVPNVRVVPDTGPPGLVNVHNTGTAVTHTVRIQPSPGTSITTIKEDR